MGRAIAVDDLGDAYIVGETNSRRKEPQFPTTSDAFLPAMRVTTLGGPSPFLSRLSPDGKTLVYSTFFKNPDAIEYLQDLAIDGTGKAYVTGYTASNKWPTTPGAFSTSNTGHVDAVVTVIDTEVAGEAGLVATPVSSSAIALSWTDNSWNEDGFAIERSSDGSSGWTLLLTTGANVASYEDSGLGPQETWYYRVRAVNGVGASGDSNIASATTFPPAVGVNVDTITPSSMNAGTTISVTITGSGFASGATISFENGQGPAPTASNVNVVSTSEITCTLSVSSGGLPGTRVWDVRVTNPDSSTGVLSDGFSVIK